MLSETSRSVHFIGIGGVGMSGIAKVAYSQGLDVTGSDMKASKYTQQLRDLGIPVTVGHSGSNLPEGNPTIVVSTAILDNNPELIEAKSRGLDIIHRAEMLAMLGRSLKTLAVAGTHGKTTTSSMLAHVMDEIGEDPTFLIGGTVRKYGTNARSGNGPWYVVEADESDKSFNHLSPYAAIVTNIEPDHLDHYDDLADIYANFASFMGSVPEGNPLVVWHEDAELVKLAAEVHGTDGIVTYGFGEDADVRITESSRRGISSDFTVSFPDGRTVESCIKQNPGIHNVLNGTAVLSLVYSLGLDVEAAAESLKEFSGVRRRFDLVGEERGITVVDDYAHHPTEIASTIKAASDLGYGRVHVLFQPHRYSRASLFTDVLHDEFSHAFDDADNVFFMDVFSAGEAPIPGINGRTFMGVVTDNPDHPPIRFIPRRIDIPKIISEALEPGDLLITMGAGDVTELGTQILRELEGIAEGETDSAGASSDGPGKGATAS